jgi:hypothetical protein
MSANITLLAVDASTQTLYNADLETYNVSVVLADDQQTPMATKLAAVITCTLDKNGWTQFQQFLNQYGNRMQSVSMVHTGNPSDALVYLSRNECSDGGPYVQATAQEVMGTTLMLARIDVTAERPLCQDRPILSHVWRQSMQVEENGRLTRTIEGQLKAFRYAPGTTLAIAPPNLPFANVNSYAGIADLFRQAILGNVPDQGWRRISQAFVYDPSETTLQYTVTDKQFMHDLPNYVRVGDMEFTYERSAETAGVANCFFSCDLETDNNARRIGPWGTGNRTLVEAAVALSKTRINAAFSNVLITRMRVTERGLLSGQAIRFELDAQMFPSLSGGGAGANSVAPLAFMIGQQFTIARTQSRTMDAYGQATRSVSGTSEIYNWHVMQPHWVQEMFNGMEKCGEVPSGNLPYAVLWTDDIDLNNSGSISVTVGTTEVDNEMNTAFEGKFATNVFQEPADDDDYSTIVAHNVSMTNAAYESGVVRLSPMYTTGSDVVFQTQKPAVRVKERIEVARANQAPNKVFRPLPTGAFVLNEDWNVSFGKFDAQGQRMFVGTYERTYQVWDQGDTGRGFVTQATTAAGNVRAWGAPNQTVLPTIAKIATTASQGLTTPTFGTAGVTTAERYSTGPAETFVT